MATDPQSLVTLAKCYLCQGISMAEAMQLALLSQLATSGVSFGQQAFSGNGPPGAQVPAGNAGTYYDYANQALYNWNPTLNGGAGGWQ